MGRGSTGVVNEDEVNRDEFNSTGVSVVGTVDRNLYWTVVSYR